MCLSLPGFARDRLIEARQRLLQTAEFRQRHAAQDMRAAPTRLRRQSPLRVSETVFEQSLLAGDLRQPIEDIRICGRKIKHALITLRGLCQAALATEPGSVLKP